MSLQLGKEQKKFQRQRRFSQEGMCVCACVRAEGVSANCPHYAPYVQANLAEKSSGI